MYLQGGNIDPAKDIADVLKISGNTLPQVSAGGQLTLTLHQVNVSDVSRPNEHALGALD